MGGEWSRHLFEDCMEKIIDYRGKTPKKTEAGIPLITAKIIKNGSIQPASEFIAESEYVNWMRRGIPKPGDIVLTTEAPLGEVAQLGNQKIALAQRVITLRGKKGFLDNTFLKYLLISNEIQHQLDSRGTGTTVKGIKQSELRKIELPIPQFETQKAIAHILGTLDDKIELNRQTNKTLEAMAQALFKSWFVDFDPVIDNALAAGNEIPEALHAKAEARKALGEARKPLPEDIRKLFPSSFVFTEEMGWVPEGWEVKRVEELVNRLKVTKKFTKNNVLNFGPHPVFDQGSGLILGYHDESADIEASKTYPRFIFGDHTCITHLSLKPFSVGPNVIPLEPEGYNPYWVYYAIKDLQEFQEYRRHWMEFKIKSVLVPDRKLDEIYGINIIEFHSKIELNFDQSVYLSRIRDTLLPKLISGELRIPDAEKLVKDAGL